ncbi:hypothetical protein FDE85_02555 [Clostridium botulinum]|nr:hypothetical protein [Clostridium botulinum]NFR89907.1 hypothetical protein [Clostridium botulinum]NFT97960.1 hypothetical protein [Clostridium botulinum]
MVYIKKNYIKDNKISYFYQPEKRGEFGEVIYDIDKETLELVKIAEEDIPNKDFYLNHVYRMLRDFKEKNEYLEENTACWY